MARRPGRVALFFAAALLIVTQANSQTRGTFERIGDMTQARAFHTATLMQDGRVLIAGGESATAEIFDPATGAFRATAPMSQRRYRHSATLLPDGKILIAGGGQSRVAELFDPATETFSPIGSMISLQFGQAATLLHDGTVLFSGGLITPSYSPSTAQAELYDPSTGTFSLTGRYESAAGLYGLSGPAGATASLLSDGRVLIVANNPSDIYDPATRTFRMTSRLVANVYMYGMFWHTSTSLATGDVLITGGNDDFLCGAFERAELFDAASEKFVPLGIMNAGRDLHTATLLRDGTVLLMGGGSGSCFIPTTDTTERFDAGRRVFVADARMNEPRAAHTATLLRDGTVLITGGLSYHPRTVRRSAELYRPAAQKRPRSVRR